METTKFGSRRAVLKASVAVMAFAGAGGVLAACSDKTATAGAVADPIVETRYGKVKGYLEDGITVFKGVRYGADTATTRFQPPKEPEPWTDVKDALAYAASAPQPASGDGGGLFKSWRQDPPLPRSEDCLFLNVWTPALDGKKRPVLVWFHGGGFVTGSGSSYAYDGVRLAKRGDVVVVTTNHRLNLFGYLNLSLYGEQFASSGAVGALDMVQSLEWVHDNIEKFGGDPGNVLIFGESGGGSKVCTLMAMDHAKGLFHRAVVQSGPRVVHQETAAATKAADEVVKKLGLTEATIGEILTRPIEEIQAAAQGVAGAGVGPSLSTPTPRHPFDPDAPVQSNGIPLLIGSNRTEGTSLEGGTNPALFDVTFDTVGKELQRALPGRDVKKIIDLYRKNHPDIEAPELYFMATADDTFFRRSVTIADRKSAVTGGAPVFFYMLDWETPVMEGKRYVPHALDIGMVFDNVAKSESMSGPPGPEAQAIADQMSESWLAFAKTGNPANPKVGDWPANTAAQRNMMVFRAQPGVEVDIRAAERAITASPGT
jgi:para-nitrobenzyl esterase